jgi:hypothetical protein
MNQNTVYESGRKYLDAGLSVIPIRADGSKAPAVPTWKEYQTKRFTKTEWENFHRNSMCIAVLGGAISGNLEILDFDDPEVFPLWTDRVEHFNSRLAEKLVIVQTPSKGFHVYYKSSESVNGNLKLAQKAGENGRAEVLIETRGEGGYVIAPPSLGSCHPSGNKYQLLKGDLNAIQLLTSEERTLLLELARSFNQYFPKNKVIRGDARSGGGRPGDVFNSKFIIDDWYDLLEKHDWEKVQIGGGEVEYWRRPGKDEPGVSASLNFQGSNLLYVFSSNAAPFEPDKAYTPFAAYTLLEHAGDFSSAAKALLSGDLVKSSGTLENATTRRKQRKSRQEEIEVGNYFENLGELLDAELPHIEEVLKFVERGTVSQFVATTNTGKTTMMLNASLALATGQQLMPLVPEVGRPRRVLYVDMETSASKAQNALRRMLSVEPYRPPAIRQLARENLRLVVDRELDDLPLNLSNTEHLEFLENEVLEFGAELVIIDNLSAAFELDNENDNAEALRTVMKPLNGFAKKTNAATILVHHTGKPGENSTKSMSVFMGRGASNFSSLSRTVYALMPATEMGPGYVVLHNTKNKSGWLLEPVMMKLDFESLWFAQVEIKEREDITAQDVSAFVESKGEASTADIKAYFLGRGFKSRTIERRIKDAERLNLVSKPTKRAKYRANKSIGDNLGPEVLVVSDSY